MSDEAAAPGASWRRPWQPAEDALLGKLIDKKVAQRTGRSVHSVARRRRELGIPALGARTPQTQRPWTAEEDDLLGTVTDKDLALRLGCLTKEVFWRRRRLGRKPYCHGRPPVH
jgi:hypothetical protein